MTTATTVDYKYHIYELVDGEWNPVSPVGMQSKDFAETQIELIRGNYPDITFKLVTEKITTVHEFMEEGSARPPKTHCNNCEEPVDSNRNDCPECHTWY